MSFGNRIGINATNIGTIIARYSCNPIWRLGNATGRSLGVRSFPSLNRLMQHGINPRLDPCGTPQAPPQFHDASNKHEFHFSNRRKFFLKAPM
jgi:hypothetical protein